MMEIPKERLTRLQNGLELLTPEEMRDGWHFSAEWDEMLIHKSWKEAEGCGCAVCRGTCDCEVCKNAE